MPDYIHGLSRKYPAVYYEKWRHSLKKIQDTGNIEQRTMIPQSPYSDVKIGTSHSSLIFVDHILYTFNILGGSACCRPSRTWMTFSRSVSTFELFVPHFYLCWTHCIIPESLLDHLNRFCRRMCKLNAKFDADLLLYSLSHFECNGHTVRMLSQCHLPPPLTSTVKSSLFTLVHSRPLPLAARLHRCT